MAGYKRRRSSYSVGSSYKRKRTSYRRRAPTRTSRRLYRRTRYRPARRARRTRWPRSPWPMVKRAKLTWVHIPNVIIDAAGSLGYQTYTMNSLYDPNTSIGGTQPFGFDEMMALYGRYQVFGCKISLLVSPLSETGSNLYVIPTQNSALPSYANIEELRRRPFARTMFLLKDSGRGGTNKYKLRQYYSVKKLDRVIANGLNQQEDYIGTSAQDPSEKLYLHLIHTTTSGTAATPIELYIRVELTFYCQFSQPITPAYS